MDNYDDKELMPSLIEGPLPYQSITLNVLLQRLLWHMPIKDSDFLISKDREIEELYKQNTLQNFPILEDMIYSIIHYHYDAIPHLLTFFDKVSIDGVSDNYSYALFVSEQDKVFLYEFIFEHISKLSPIPIG
jgi:hypothetical protein